MRSLFLIFVVFNSLINVSFAQKIKKQNACLCLISETDSVTNLNFGIFKEKNVIKYVNDKFNPVFIPQTDSNRIQMVKLKFYNSLFIPLFISPFETYVSNKVVKKGNINESLMLHADSIFEAEFNMVGLEHADYFNSPGFYYKCRKVKIEFIEIEQSKLKTENRLYNLKPLKHKKWGLTTRIEILKT